MTYNSFKKMKKNEDYFVKIDSKFSKGFMNYGEIYLPGKSKKEILFSTYICHPSMANNELSGPVVSIFLSKWLSKKKNYYSYRFIFIPETIGSIYYINKNINHLKKNVLSIFNVNCVGDVKNTSLLGTKYGNLSVDKLVQNILNKNKINFKQYSWEDRGSDERQYMSPGVDIPTVSLMSSKYREYSEYHTSDDNLDFISQKGLKKHFELYKKIIAEFDRLIFPKSKYLGEPNLGKRNLYPQTNDFSINKTNRSRNFSRLILSFLSYSDGNNSIQDIARHINLDYKGTFKIYKLVKKNNLILNDEKYL
jgi:aminopeptidase-like protein